MSTDTAVVVAGSADMFMPVMDIRQATARRNALVQFVQGMMVKDRDFGVVPGTGTKPTLLKPGAEKLTTFFGLSPVFVADRIVENFGDDGSEPLFFYRYRCELYRNGSLVGSGIGSCNSRESKYRYRNGERICPTCGKATIIKGKEEYGGGWICFAKKGGCGAKFKAGDPAVEGQTVGKVVNPDVADLVNTIDKMAQKRALIAATLIAVNASEFFTQDVEDMAIDAEYTVTKEVPRNSTPPAAATVTTTGNGGAAGNGHAAQNQRMVMSSVGYVTEDAAKRHAADVIAENDQSKALPARAALWDSPAAAYAWAVEAGACANEFEAQTSMKKIVSTQFGGRLTKENMAAAMDAFHARQMEKLHERAESAVQDAPEMDPDALTIPA